MSVYNLEFLFKPRHIALLGIEKEEDLREILLKNLLSQKFRGDVYLVNKNPLCIFGRESYPSLLSIPGPIDLAILSGVDGEILKYLEECAQKGVKGVIIIERDFKARVSSPQRLLKEIYRFVEKYKMRILGPNTLGFIRPPFKLNASVIPESFPRGNLAFVSDSATLSSAVLDWVLDKKVGLSLFVSLGEKVDIDLADMVDYLSMDPYTKALVIYLEHLKGSRKFIGAARAFARTKPIMVVKHGRFAPFKGETFTPLASLLTEDMVYNAVFRRTGIIRVEEILELFYVAESLSKQPRPKNSRLAIISNAGAPSLIAIDTLLKYQGTLAQLSSFTKEALREFLPLERVKNPIDLLSDASPNQYREAVSLCLKDPEVDGVLVIYTPEIIHSSEEIAWAIVKGAQRSRYKPVLACFMGEKRVRKARKILNEQNIPHFVTPVEAVKSFLYMYKYEHLLKLLFETPGSILEDFRPRTDRVKKIIRSSALEGRLFLSSKEAFNLLESYGITDTPPSSSEDPFPLALGMVKDPIFGAVVILATGGKLTSFIKDISLGLPPLNQTLARRIIEQTRAYSLLQEKFSSLKSLEELLVRFSQLIVDFPEIREMEINPLLFHSRGYSFSKVKIYLEEFAFLPSQRGRTLYCPSHLAICPYPSHFIFQVCLKDGSIVKVRPIKPEDEPLMAELFYSLSEETIRFRFMQPKKTISHEELVRYCQIDYDRELALVALLEKEKKIIGVVRLIKYPDEENAEMAVLVGDAWQGKGLGWLLCSQMIHVARQMNLKRIWMDILQENIKMLGLARKLGFKVYIQEEDIIRVVLEL